MNYFPLGTPGEEGSGKTVVFGIAAGSDGALWFTTSSGFGRMTTSGTVSLMPAPTADGSPELITTGPDGAVWFTERVANKIVRKFVAAVPAVPGRHRSVRH